MGNQIFTSQTNHNPFLCNTSYSFHTHHILPLAIPSLNYGNQISSIRNHDFNSFDNIAESDLYNKPEKCKLNPENTTISSKKNSVLRAQYCNIRSICNKVDLVKNHIDGNADIDLIFLTETWLNDKIPNSVISPKNYDVIRADRQLHKGGGVLLFYNNRLQVDVIKCPESLHVAEGDYEIMCVDVYNGKEPCRFCCLYIPPRSSLNQYIVEEVCKTIKSLFVDNEPIFIIGDFNLPLINWDDLTIQKIRNSQAGYTAYKIFLDFCAENCLNQLIHEPTHNKGNILDLILCNSNAHNLLLSSSVLNPLSSSCDHFLMSFNINHKNRKQIRPISRYPDFKNANYEKINLEVSEFLNNQKFIFNSSSTLKETYDKFVTFLHTLIGRHVPLKSSNSTVYKRPRHINILLQEKLSLYKKYKMDKSLKEKYKKKSKQYDVAVQKWQDENEIRICNNPSSKKFYNFFRGKMKSNSSIPPLHDSNNNIHTSNLDKANLLNSFFHEVFQDDDGVVLDCKYKTNNIMKDFSIDFSDVMLSLHTLKDKITRTPEQIPSYFLKRIGPSITEFLVPFFNACLHFNFVPIQWKTAIVIPIFKKGENNVPNNYRPISLTSSLSRLFEIIIYNILLHHFLSLDLFSPNQFGFLPLRSSCAQLMKCLHDWYANLYKNKSTHVIYTDIQKAFDSVSHNKLIIILKSYGINTTLLHWIKNFLSDRIQQVVIEDSFSSPCSLSSGIPQGSILGPLLFLIYINDIDNCSQPLDETGGISLFADDAKMYATDPSKLQYSINLVGEWLQKHQLRLAPNKCSTLHISKTSQNPDFYLNSNLISTTECIKDLGILITENLNWTKHIDCISRNATASSYHIIRFTKTRNIWTLKKLFTTYTRSKLEYNTPIWTPTSIEDKTKIEKIQRDFTRLVFKRCNLSYSSYSDRLKQINLKSLEYRRIFNDIVFMHKIINGLAGINFNDFFKYHESPYALRGKRVRVETKLKCNSSLWLNSFFTRGPSLWNALPEEITKLECLKTFRQRLHQFDLNSIAKLTFT